MRLWTLLNGTWDFNDYTFGTPIAALGTATLTSPANGSTLPTASTTFTWNSLGRRATLYALWVGTSRGSYDLYSGIEGLNTSKTLTLPTDGRPLFVQLWTMSDDGVWLKPNYYTLTAFSPPGRTPASITTPTSGSTLPLGSTTLNWTAANGAQQYALWVGSTPDAYDIYAGTEGTNLSKNLTLPADGRPVYVRLWTSFNGEWKSYTSSTFTTSIKPGPAKAQILTPANGSTLTSTSVTLTWNAGNLAEEYGLWVGSTVGAYDLYMGGEALRTSKTLTLPADGRAIYVRLWTKFNGTWSQYNDYVFTTPTSP